VSIVTKTGDQGATSLLFGRRVPKYDPRVEACGTIDELNAALGLARASLKCQKARQDILAIQAQLVPLMGELAVDPSDFPRYVREGFQPFDPILVTRLEELITKIESEGVSFRGWATPGETFPGAALEVARTVCRRAERKVCEIADKAQLRDGTVIIYLNRLSDLLWLMARQADSAAPSDDAA
jgi:cob(I)alamin adenosyltransferase